MPQRDAITYLFERGVVHEHELLTVLVKELEELVWPERCLLHALGRAKAAIRLVACLDFLHFDLSIQDNTTDANVVTRQSL